MDRSLSNSTSFFSSLTGGGGGGGVIPRQGAKGVAADGSSYRRRTIPQSALDGVDSVRGWGKGEIVDLGLPQSVWPSSQAQQQQK